MQSADLVAVCRQGAMTSLAPEELLPGDVVLLEAGHKVPADVRVLATTDSALVDNAALPGESAAEPRRSAPVAMAGDQSPSVALVEAPNVLFSGTSIVEGRLAGREDQVGFESIYTVIFLCTCTCMPILSHILLQSESVFI